MNNVTIVHDRQTARDLTDDRLSIGLSERGPILYVGLEVSMRKVIHDDTYIVFPIVPAQHTHEMIIKLHRSVFGKMIWYGRLIRTLTCWCENLTKVSSSRK
jgi:hypothetical protein